MTKCPYFKETQYEIGNTIKTKQKETHSTQRNLMTKTNTKAKKLPQKDTINIET